MTTVEFAAPLLGVRGPGCSIQSLATGGVTQGSPVPRQQAGRGVRGGSRVRTGKVGPSHMAATERHVMDEQASPRNSVSDLVSQHLATRLPLRGRPMPWGGDVSRQDPSLIITLTQECGRRRRGGR